MTSSSGSSRTRRTGAATSKGDKTKRVYGLFGKTARARHDGRPTRTCSRSSTRCSGEYQLSAPTGIEIGPGERAPAVASRRRALPDPAPAPRARRQHHVAAVRLHRSRTARRASFPARSTGSTDDSPGPDAETIDIEMPAGSALVYLGNVWHGGGANTTDEAAPRRRVALRPRVVASGREPRAGRAARSRARRCPSAAGAARLQHRQPVHRLRRRPPPEEDC